MSLFDDDRPQKPAAHQIGSDLRQAAENLFRS